MNPPSPLSTMPASQLSQEALAVAVVKSSEEEANVDSSSAVVELASSEWVSQVVVANRTINTTITEVAEVDEGDASVGETTISHKEIEIHLSTFDLTGR